MANSELCAEVVGEPDGDIREAFTTKVRKPSLLLPHLKLQGRVLLALNNNFQGSDRSVLENISAETRVVDALKKLMADCSQKVKKAEKKIKESKAKTETETETEIETQTQPEKKETKAKPSPAKPKPKTTLSGAGFPLVPLGKDKPKVTDEIQSPSKCAFCSTPLKPNSHKATDPTVLKMRQMCGACQAKLAVISGAVDPN
jgi:hypothetical protein